MNSKTRGANRFPALVRALNLLRERSEVKARKVNVPSYPALEDWIKRESKLGNATLAAEVDGGNEDLSHIKIWSDAINEQVSDIVHGVPPFPLLQDTLDKSLNKADMMVISQTPCDALEREWAEHDISKYVEIIAGQEMGTKTEHLKYSAVNKYDSNKILMIGDAPGDHKAAKDNKVLFYPIIPGNEEHSWERLYTEALDRFFAGSYEGAYEEKLFSEFDNSLPEKPNW